jgi:hypothetical protein
MRQDSTRANPEAVIPGLVPGIHRSARSGVCRGLDPGDERRDDTPLLTYAALSREV